MQLNKLQEKSDEKGLIPGNLVVATINSPKAEFSKIVVSSLFTDDPDKYLSSYKEDDGNKLVLLLGRADENGEILVKSENIKVIKIPDFMVKKQKVSLTVSLEPYVFMDIVNKSLVENVTASEIVSSKFGK